MRGLRIRYRLFRVCGRDRLGAALASSQTALPIIDWSLIGAIVFCAVTWWLLMVAILLILQ